MQVIYRNNMTDAKTSDISLEKIWGLLLKIYEAVREDEEDDGDAKETEISPQCDSAQFAAWKAHKANMANKAPRPLALFRKRGGQ